MAQTISELEKERAELLKAIESQAQNISSNRSAEDDLDGHTLKDWLNAAEEVMPSKPNTTKSRNTQASQPSLSSKPATGKASFFGVIILLSLLLTILGVLYIAYSTVDRELKEVKEVKQSSQAEAVQLQESMNKLEQTVATGGTPERFVELEQRVLELESQLALIQKQQLELLAKLERSNTMSNSANVVAQQPIDGVKNNDPTLFTDTDKVLTESVLDAKLKAYTSGLESRIDEKLSMILDFLTKGEVKPELKEKVLLNGSDKKVEPIEIQEPIAPTVLAPRIQQPLVKMVEQVSAPSLPKVKKPMPANNEDINWLLKQPEQHYVLQLASMTDKQSLMNMVSQKGLTDTRIVLQKRDNNQRYVLISGSYANRNDANSKSKEIKGQFGISPWIRKMKDLTVKLP